MSYSSRQFNKLALKSPRKAWLDKPLGVFWTSLCFSLLFCGYPMVSFVPNFISVRDRDAAVVFRALCLLLSFIVAVKEFRHARRQGAKAFSVWLVVAVFFWAAYLGRILSDRVMMDGIGPLPLFDFLAYTFGISAATLFTMLTVRDPARLRHAPAMCVVISAIVCALASYFGLENYTTEMAGRLFANERLNPILLGHSAVIMIIGVLWLLFINPREGSSDSASVSSIVTHIKNMLLVVANVGLLVMGAYTLVLSSSRSPFIALLVCTLLLIFWLKKRAAFLIVLVLIVGGIVVRSGLLSSLVNAGLDVERMTHSVTLDDDYMQGGRVDLYAEAFGKFLESPLWGKTLFNDSLSYPHNIVIEALMALGLLGGGLMVAMLFGAARGMVLASRQTATGRWLLLAFLQAFVGTMTSGAIFYDPMIWTTLGVGLGLSELNWGRSKTRVHGMQSGPRLPV